MRTFRVWLPALALALAACSTTSNQYPEGAIVVVGREMEFQSDLIEVQAGAPVTLVLENEGTLEHALVIDALGVEITHVTPGHNGAATFTPETPGVYTFYCSVPGHKEAKMTGTLKVNP